MPPYLLDTDIFTLYRAKHPRVTARVSAHPPGDVSPSAVTVEEQVGGWYVYLRQATRPDQVERAYGELVATVQAFGPFRVWPYTRAAMTRYDVLLRSKLNVRKNDLRIAAIALECAATVVTRNVRDFGRVPGLAVEDWSV